MPTFRRRGIKARKVPTWNYVVVEVRGHAQLLDEQAQRRDLVDRLSAYHERNLPRPWHSDKLQPERRDALLGAIVAFRIDMLSIEAKAKLSQNRQAADARSAAAHLMAAGCASNDAQLAKLMLESIQ